jgi:hypothetical protein
MTALLITRLSASCLTPDTRKTRLKALVTNLPRRSAGQIQAPYSFMSPMGSRSINTADGQVTAILCQRAGGVLRPGQFCHVNTECSLYYQRQVTMKLRPSLGNETRVKVKLINDNRIILLTTACCPCSAAKWSGVFPSSAASLTEDPCLSNSSTCASQPCHAA